MPPNYHPPASAAWYRSDRPAATAELVGAGRQRRAVGGQGEAAVAAVTTAVAAVAVYAFTVAVEDVAVSVTVGTRNDQPPPNTPLSPPTLTRAHPTASFSPHSRALL